MDLKQFIEKWKHRLEFMNNDFVKNYDYYLQDLKSVMDKWISVADELPEKEGEYLVIYTYHPPFIAMYKDNQFRINGKQIGILHWQPLPQPPKE